MSRFASFDIIEFLHPEVSKGNALKAIAADLGIATSTVRSHLHKTYKKIGASDRAQAVLTATERGWL